MISELLSKHKITKQQLLEINKDDKDANTSTPSSMNLAIDDEDEEDATPRA